MILHLDNKTTFSLKLAAIMLPFLPLLEKYIFRDWEFLMFMAVAIILDTILGVYIHFRGKSLSSKGFAGLFEKVLIYFIVLVLAHVLKNYSVSGEINNFFPWVDRFFYAAILVREAISILENIGLINPKLLPAWLLKRLKHFDDTGNATALFTAKQKHNETNA